MTGEELLISLWDEAPYFFINGDVSDQLLETLDYELSYEVPDAQYTDAWKNNEWDGRQRLLRESKNDSLYFPIGLIHRVRDVLDALGVDYTVEGHVYPGLGDLDLAWDTDITLYDYQQEAVSDAISHGSGMVVLPTGGGKTIIGIKLMYRLRHPTVVMCHRKEIASQWVEKIEEILGHEAAKFYDGDKEVGDITVALYQSVHDDESNGVVDEIDFGRFKVANFDEGHRVGADTFSDVALSIPATYRFGFSATPNREDNATLRVIGGTGPIISDLSVERLIDQGYLAEPEWVIKESPSAGGGVGDWRVEYDQEVVENEKRNQIIAQTVEDLEPPVLVTVERINHGERLEARVQGAKFIHGDSSTRDEDIQAFRDGDLDILIATRGIVGEGFDVPEIASFVVAGGMKSSTSMIQQVGRALRPETEKATIVDFWDKGRWVADHSESRIRTYQDYYGEYGP